MLGDDQSEEMMVAQLVRRFPFLIVFRKLAGAIRVLLSVAVSYMHSLSFWLCTECNPVL